MSNDPVQSWLNTAGRLPLLPKSEIIRLAKKRDTLEPESKAYIKVINKICEHNLRLVPVVVRTYLNKRFNCNMNSEVASDLLQQGYIGLRRAAEKYDGTRGFTFSTYANRWISQAVSRWHNSHDRTIYIPENSMCEFLYRRRHGHPSKSKNGRIRNATLAATSRAIDISSIDRFTGTDTDTVTIADMMSDNNRILSNKTQLDGIAELQLKELMAECLIKPRTQDIVLSYAKRGRMSIVASRLSLSSKHCQNLYQEAVRLMKDKVAAKEAAKKARWSARMGK